ncbi:MAG TPA: hypothetical protein VHE81_21630 [Lacipirellulaceae bacterium]|nr:hypothetical protein [Lacipirellulaceae bacterium]
MFRHAVQSVIVAIVCAAGTNGLLLMCTGRAAADRDAQTDAQSDAVTKEPTHALTTPTVPNKPGAKQSSTAQGATDSEKLKMRPGERSGAAPQGQSLVLGMSIQEAKNGLPEVIDVAAASPAWDAGIKKGDEIVVFQGFKGDSYRKWIDAMRRLSSGLPEGAPILVVVSRNGKQTAYRVLSPGPGVRLPPQNPLAQQGNPVVPSPTETPAEGLAGPVAMPANGGNNVVVDNAGPFGAFFAGQPEGASERAMAQIVRLNVVPPSTGGESAAAPATGAEAANINGAANTSTGTNTVPPQGRARIGLAGFHDDPTGMVVMVDVGALPAGTYSVGVSDPSVMGKLSGSGSSKRPIQSQSAGAGLGAASSPGAASITAPAGKSQSSTTAPSGQVPTLGTSIGVQNQSNQSSAAAATSPLNASSAQGEQPPQNAASSSQAKGVVETGGAIAGATLNEIGTITITQRGTGQMQQTVKGVKVRDVVGQAIVIYATNSTSQRAVPDTNERTGAEARQAGGPTSSARGSQGNIGGNQRTTTSQAVATSSVTAGSRVPVAGGIIRLVSDRRPPAPGEESGQAQAGTKSNVERPASATPTTGSKVVR